MGKGREEEREEGGRKMVGKGREEAQEGGREGGGRGAHEIHIVHVISHNSQGCELEKRSTQALINCATFQRRRGVFQYSTTPPKQIKKCVRCTCTNAVLCIASYFREL